MNLDLPIKRRPQSHGCVVILAAIGALFVGSCILRATCRTQEYLAAEDAQKERLSRLTKGLEEAEKRSSELDVRRSQALAAERQRDQLVGPSTAECPFVTSTSLRALGAGTQPSDPGRGPERAEDLKKAFEKSMAEATTQVKTGLQQDEKLPVTIVSASSWSTTEGPARSLFKRKLATWTTSKTTHDLQLDRTIHWLAARSYWPNDLTIVVDVQGGALVASSYLYDYATERFACSGEFKSNDADLVTFGVRRGSSLAMLPSETEEPIQRQVESRVIEAAKRALVSRPAQ